jgi:ABC-2 type transport system ATP-binding protein
MPAMVTLNEPGTGADEAAPALSAEGLTRRFGALTAVGDVSFALARGRCLALVGPNGAGKSTLLALLQGRLRPDAGRVRVFGLAPGAPALAGRIGIVLQGTDFPPEISPREVIRFAAAHYAAPLAAAELADAFGLDALLDRRMAGFSGGELRRVALALGFVGRPELVYLDEPTAGLDALARARLHEVLRGYCAAGGTLVLASHHWDEIEALADELLILHHGRCLRWGSRAAVIADLPRRRVRFRLRPPAPPPVWVARSFTPTDGFFEADPRDSDAVVRRLVAEGVAFEALEVKPTGLHDILDGLVGTTAARAPAAAGEGPGP